MTETSEPKKKKS